MPIRRPSRTTGASAARSGGPAGMTTGWPELSHEWRREIQRRVRSSDDPIRYMVVSEFSRTLILYYDVARDVFVMNTPDKATVFKRRDAAERVSKLFGRDVRVVKFTTTRGKLKRVSPFRDMSRAS